MSQTWLFKLGADVRCADGECGKLTSLVVSSGDDVVTHFVIHPADKHAFGRLVPLSLADIESAGGSSDQLRLRCTLAEFGRLDPAEATYSYPSDEDYEARPGASPASWPTYAPPGVMGAPGLPADTGVPEEDTVDIVADELPGEQEVPRGEHVHATDGDIGRVQGIAVDPDTGRVTSVLLRTGHLWGRKAVLIPRSAVAAVAADGFHLDITAQQVRDLPTVDAKRP